MPDTITHSCMLVLFNWHSFLRLLRFCQKEPSESMFLCARCSSYCQPSVSDHLTEHTAQMSTRKNHPLASFTLGPLTPERNDAAPFMPSTCCQEEKTQHKTTYKAIKSTNVQSMGQLDSFDIRMTTTMTTSNAKTVNLTVSFLALASSTSCSIRFSCTHSHHTAAVTY